MDCDQRVEVILYGFCYLIATLIFITTVLSISQSIWIPLGDFISTCA